MKFFVIILSLLLSGVSSFSQNVDVDPYTGRALVNVPLLQVNDRSLTHTVGLAYDASGLKVDARSGGVGLNWSLIAGGSVRRELRGLPDDLNESTKKGWLYSSNASTIGSHTYSADGTGLDCDDENTEFNFIDAFGDSLDTEPDIFHFSAGSISGSFVFDNTGSISNIRLIPYQDIQVKAVLSGTYINKFVLTTADGTKYSFELTTESVLRKADKGVIEQDPLYFRRDYHQYKNGINYISSWYLSTITSPSGELISFNYTASPGAVEYPVISGQELEIAIDDGITNDPETLEMYSITETYTPRVLTSITTPHQTLYFTWIGSTLTNNRALLQSISLNEINHYTSAFVKKIYFNYLTIHTFHAAGSLPRVFLRDVRVVDPCKAHEPVSFEYYSIVYGNTTTIPAPGSFKQDIWGYHMDFTGGHKFPQLYVYPGEDGIHRISLYPQPGVSGEIEIPGANRIQETTPVAGTLKKVSYPTGATTELYYEPHEFYNPIIDTLSKGGGLRVKKIETYDGVTNRNNIVRTFEYAKPDGKSSGVLLSMPTFWQLSASYLTEDREVKPYDSLSGLSAEQQWNKMIIRTEDNLNPDFYSTATVGYARVTEKNSSGKGKTVYEYEIPYRYGDSPDSVWNPTFIHIARKKTSGVCPDVALNEPGYYQHPFVIQTPYDFGRGLLVRTSVYAEGESEPEHEVINTYETLSIAGTPVKGLYYEYIPVDTTQYYFMYGAYTLRTNRLKVLTGSKERVRSKTAPYNYLASETLLTYGTSHSFLTSTAIAESDSTVNITRFKYAADYPTGATNGGTDLQVRMIESLKKKKQGGTLVEQTYSRIPHGGTETTYGGTLHLFDDFDPSADSLVLVKEVQSLRTNGESSFAMSSFSGSGTSRTFTANSNYKMTSTQGYLDNGDLVYAENNQRLSQEFHRDTKTGLPVAVISGAQAHEVVYSNFDQYTEHGFDTVGFSLSDINSYYSKSGSYSLQGWRLLTANTNYLTKTFRKKPDSEYKFSLWFLTTWKVSTYSLRVIIKDQTESEVYNQLISFSVDSVGFWYYGEHIFDLGSIATDSVTVELWSNVVGKLENMVDEVTFAPVDADITYYTYKTQFGAQTITAPDGQMVTNEMDPAGKVKAIRDHAGNIRQRMSYTAYVKEQSIVNPLSISTEETIYADEETTFTASMSCIDVATLEWKVSPASNPTSGSYFSGSDEEPYTFTSTGNFVVWLKVSHSSYGSYEVSKNVTVILAPLDVEICVLEGPVEVDLCTWTMNTMETQACPGETLDLVPTSPTTFSVSASGCSGGSYTYYWYTYPYASQLENPTFIGNGQTIEVFNFDGYGFFIVCEVTSSCGKTGTSNLKSVYVYRSDPSCEGPFAD